MEEIWKLVPDYEGLYEVSNLGRVRRLQTCSGTHAGLILALKTTGKGYFDVILYGRGRPKHRYIHRLVATAFVPNPENKPEVNHKDGNKQNNLPDNLEWLTQKEHHEHTCGAGLMRPAQGEDHGKCKLTEAQVLEIREKAKNKTFGFNAQTAREYGVSPQSISAIIHKQTWRHI